jgi:hypothetical protein
MCSISDAASNVSPFWKRPFPRRLILAAALAGISTNSSQDAFIAT